EDPRLISCRLALGVADDVRLLFAHLVPLLSEATFGERARRASHFEQGASWWQGNGSEDGGSAKMSAGEGVGGGGTGGIASGRVESDR
ncbi:MAG: hypothetical protein CVV45_20725, partial [Spirochaetae bacterium HGW-Spirochaetae-10]